MSLDKDLRSGAARTVLRGHRERPAVAAHARLSFEEAAQHYAKIALRERLGSGVSDNGAARNDI